MSKCDKTKSRANVADMTSKMAGIKVALTLFTRKLFGG